jgi:hypothetical protein
MSTREKPMTRKVIFEFSRGCMDGKTVCSDSEDPQEASEADGYYFLTDNLTVGRRFKSATPLVGKGFGQRARQDDPGVLPGSRAS